MNPDVLTRREQEHGATVVRRWGRDMVLWTVRLPERERNVVLLAAGLLDLAPGEPLDTDPILLP